MPTQKKTKKRTPPGKPDLPGVFKLTASAFSMFSQFKNHYLILLLIYVVVSLLLIGVAQQQQYQLITDAINGYGVNVLGELDGFTATLGIFGLAVTGAFNASLNEVQQVYVTLVSLLFGLTLIWLLRHLLAGNKVKVRDALYNGGAALIPTLLVGLLMIVQALPAAIAILIFSIAAQTSSIVWTVVLVIGIIAIPLVLLSLYWLISSIFALLIVTLPGTYPMVAIRGAGKLIKGRRVAVLMRLLWVGLVVLAGWGVVLIPVLVFDNWFTVGWLPVVTFTVQVLTGASLLFGTTYLYLLYRRMIDEPSS